MTVKTFRGHSTDPVSGLDTPDGALWVETAAPKNLLKFRSNDGNSYSVGLNSPTIYTGSGSPVGTQTGVAGDIYINEDNGIRYMFWNTAASNNTDWAVI